MTRQDATREKLEALYEVDTWKRAEEVQVAIKQDCPQLSTHIFESGRGLTYNAMCMIDDGQGHTILAVGTLQKWTDIKWLASVMTGPTAEDMDKMAALFEDEIDNQINSMRDGK
jgi:hypothetical protein